MRIQVVAADQEIEGHVARDGHEVVRRPKKRQLRGSADPDHVPSRSSVASSTHHAAGRRRVSPRRSVASPPKPCTTSALRARYPARPFIRQHLAHRQRRPRRDPSKSAAVGTASHQDATGSLKAVSINPLPCVAPLLFKRPQQRPGRYRSSAVPDEQVGSDQIDPNGYPPFLWITAPRRRTIQAAPPFAVACPMSAQDRRAPSRAAAARMNAYVFETIAQRAALPSQPTKQRRDNVARRKGQAQSIPSFVTAPGTRRSDEPALRRASIAVRLRFSCDRSRRGAR